MTRQHHPSDIELAAFAAGTLAEVQRVDIASHVGACEKCHEFVRAMIHVGAFFLENLPPTPLADRSLTAVMAQLDEGVNGGGKHAEPTHPAMFASVHGGRTQVGLTLRNWALRAASAVLLVALGATGGWFAREWSASATGPTTPPSLIARALDAHVVYAADQRHPIEVPATERDHLNTWLSRRIQHQIEAPHLAGAGYSLLGGRLLSDRGKPAALFMYQDAAGKRLTVFVVQTEEREETGSQHIVREDLRAVSWSEGPLTLAVTGPVDAVRLREIGEMVRQSVKG
jgi:anti-sigma factor RsiW